MLTARIKESMPRSTFVIRCDNCGEPAAITMIGYGEGGDCNCCAACALQLSRMLLEDLCDLAGKRHG